MANWPLHFTYNDKAVLLLAGVCAASLFLNAISFGKIGKLLECRPVAEMKLYDIHRLLLFPLVHTNAAHLTNNFATILLLGPNQETRFGYYVLMKMFLVCALATGVTNAFIFKTNLVGANSIVFGFLILYCSQYISFRKREVQTIPLTFALLFSFWLSKEISMAFSGHGSSGFAHILGGVAGSSYVLKPWEDKKFGRNLSSFLQDFGYAITDSFSEITRGEFAFEFPSIPSMASFKHQGEELSRRAKDLTGTVVSAVRNDHQHDD